MRLFARHQNTGERTSAFALLVENKTNGRRRARQCGRPPPPYASAVELAPPKCDSKVLPHEIIPAKQAT